MLTHPGSVLWLCLLVYFAAGQHLDITDLDTSDRGLDEIERFINDSYIQFNGEEKETRDPQLEAGEEENKRQSDLINEQSEPLVADTITSRPRNLLNKLQESNGITSTELINGRNKRRRIVNRTVNPVKVTEIPLMSPERRNSYLSIAERRKYYNRTRPQQKKLDLSNVELDIQETTNKLVISSTTETLQTNEIRVNKKPIVKDSNRVVTDKKNQTNYQRVYQSPQGNQTQPKPQSTRQSVIQSQYEFGQKLRKPNPRGQEFQDEMSKRKKDKSKIEQIMENSTNKLGQSYSTQSTKLVRVDKSSWSTTTEPEPDVEVENFVLFRNRNGTHARKLENYVTVNDTKSNADELSNKTIEFDDHVTETNNVPPSSSKTFKPLPLNFENTTESSFSEDKAEISRSIHSVYNQEIFKVQNTTRKTVTLPLNILQSWNGTRKYPETTTEAIVNIMKQPEPSTEATLRHFNLSATRKPSTTLNSVKPGDKPTTAANVKAVTTPSFLGSRRSGKFSNHVLSTRFSTPIPVPKPTNKVVPVGGINVTTHLVRAIPKESVNRTSVISKTQIPFSEIAIPVPKAIPPDVRHSSTTPPPAAENRTSMEEYPLTIELNENNKRVLSEMFETSSTTESRPTEKKTPKRITLKLVEPSVNTSSTVSIITTQSTTASTFTTTKTITKSTMTTRTTTTTETPQLVAPDDSPNEDHKAMGTRYNTKFYISPNVTGTQVIKVVESDYDDDDDEENNKIAAPSRSAGVAIYVLAAFGLVPLLLALVFATKFMMQRQQRQYECDSDAKSEISVSECQTRKGRKKKGVTDLKKSPSNVTTTTLVTTTRLPRVQHWENYDKQGNKNWEFPRSKLKMKTILGQGNFGQVWKAETEDLPGHEGKTRQVAVKTVKEGATEKEHAEFIKELEIMQQIGSHPNIVTLLGCCTDQEPYYLIMEYVKYGKLLTFLREHRINENYYNFSNNSDALTSRDLTVFAYCVARGMEYLASKGIIHRDLAARNVLVDQTKLCKIADFGMSRSVRDFENGQVYEERQHKGALPIRWMAPESLVYNVFTHKSDVWSFGIVMWEIVTLGSTPYPNMGAREVMRRVREGYRLERPNHCKSEFFRLITHCWSHDPNKRPDFSELRHELSNLLDNPNKDGSYVDLDRFAVDNGFHVSSKTNDLRLMERGDLKTLKRLGDWGTEDWPEDIKKSRIKKGRNNGKGTVTLTGHGSFTVNSRILEKEFKMV